MSDIICGTIVYLTIVKSAVVVGTASADDKDENYL